MHQPETWGYVQFEDQDGGRHGRTGELELFANPEQHQARQRVLQLAKTSVVMLQPLTWLHPDELSAPACCSRFALP